MKPGIDSAVRNCVRDEVSEFVNRTGVYFVSLESSRTGGKALREVATAYEGRPELVIVTWSAVFEYNSADATVCALWSSWVKEASYRQ